MNIHKDKVTEIFFLADDFCVEFSKTINSYTIGNKPKKKPLMATSEVITIMILFHLGQFKNIKHFYTGYIQKQMSNEFPKTLSYNRFAELMQQSLLPMTMLLKTCCLGDCTGISFVDSTPVRVCKNKRIKRNKVFEGLATTGKSTMGWFYGIKLHLIINDKGEILSFVITPANVDDREPLKNDKFLEKIKGKLYADKGYVSRNLTELLFVDGLHLITGIRNNMKNTLLELKD